MSQLKIYLDNYNGVYYAGTTIQGRVECYFDDNTKIRGIKVRLKCKEYNEWTDSEEYLDETDNKYKTRTVQFTGSGNILFIEQMLFGSGSGEIIVPPGKHVYPFSFNLPHDIPSTFNGPYGSIQYKVKGIVDRPLRTDYEDVFNFVVQSPIDFNTKSEDLQKKSSHSDETTVGCLCCKSGAITMNVEIEKTAFAPGDNIGLKVVIINLSNENIKRLKINLIQRTKFMVTSPNNQSKNDVTHLISLNEHGVGAHGEHTYDLKLEIPNNLQIPNFTKCSLFAVTHKLEIIGKLSKCHMDLEVDLYPELGHIQVGAVNNQFTNNQVPIFGFVAPNVAPPFPIPSPYPSSSAFPPPPGSFPYAPQPSNDKTVYPGGFPTAPNTDAGKAREAGGYPSAPPPSEIQPELPPSYDETMSSPYPLPK